MQKILAIDDDQSINNLVRQTLENKGEQGEFKVTGVLSGKQGLEELSKQTFDLVLLDYHLPGEDGLIILTELRSKYSAIPVVMLTGDYTQKVAVQAYREGASEFILKPFNRDFLLVVVRRVLDGQVQEAKLRQEEIARQAAEEANKAKNTFIVLASHHFRTPLNIISGFSEVLRKKMGDTDTDTDTDTDFDFEQGRKRLGFIIDATHQLEKLVSDVMDVVRLEDGLQLASQEVNIGKLIASVGAELKESAVSKGLVIDFVTPEELPTVMADEQRLRQVIWNLLDNAIKFSEQGKIEAIAWASDELVTVSVADTGIGIPAEKLPRIFEKFCQVDESGHQPSTGLGLYLCRQLTERMGGRIWAESEPEKGSTFHFSLTKWKEKP